MDNSTKQTTILQAVDLHFAYKRKDVEAQNVLSGVNLQLQAGQSVGIAGVSGSGKSTLLHLLAGFIEPTEGKVLFSGEDVLQVNKRRGFAKMQRCLGFVFQEHYLLPEFTLMENALLQLHLGGDYSSQSNARVESLFGELDIVDCKHKYPYQVSGGQAQRAALARALAHNPACILADEPTGNLDSANAQVVFGLLKQRVQSENCSLLMVSHAENLLQELDQCVRLREGVVVVDS